MLFRSQKEDGWPHYFYYFTPTNDQIATSDYYDMVNFAKRITVSGWCSWGYNDDVCPPKSIYAAYNSVSAPKEFHPYLQTAHYWYQEQYEEWMRWIWNKMGLDL